MALKFEKMRSFCKYLELHTLIWFGNKEKKSLKTRKSCIKNSKKSAKNEWFIETTELHKGYTGVR